MFFVKEAKRILQNKLPKNQLMEVEIWRDNCKYLKNLPNGDSVFLKHAEMKASYIYELNGWNLKTTDDKCLINKSLCYIIYNLLKIQLN